jgi:hypothetical protein
MTATRSLSGGQQVPPGGRAMKPVKLVRVSGRRILLVWPGRALLLDRPQPAQPNSCCGSQVASDGNSQMMPSPNSCSQTNGQAPEYMSAELTEAGATPRR